MTIGQSILPFHNSVNSFTRLSPSTAIVFSTMSYNPSRPYRFYQESQNECWLLNIEKAKQLEEPSRIWTQIPNHFNRYAYAAARDPVSRSVWLMGGIDKQYPHLYSSDILKISSKSVTLKDLTMEYIIRNMSSEVGRLLPKQLANDIELHKYKV